MKRKAEVQVDIEQVKGEIRRYMVEISSALEALDNEKATQAFIDFGALLQDQYPNLLLDDLRKQIGKLMVEECSKLKIPPLDFIAYFVNAREHIYEDVVTDEDSTPQQRQPRLLKMDAANKGINVFHVY